MNATIIRGAKTCLRLLEESDLGQLATWRNNPAIARHFFGPWPVAYSEQTEWYRAYRADPSQRMFLVQTPEGQAIGCLALVGIDWRNRSAELGRVLIGEEGYLAQGYAHDAVETLCRFAFDELGLHRLEARVFAGNRPAIGLYERASFEPEGTLREAVWRGGRWRDVVLYARLATVEREPLDYLCLAGLSCNAHADRGVEQ